MNSYTSQVKGIGFNNCQNIYACSVPFNEIMSADEFVNKIPQNSRTVIKYARLLDEDSEFGSGLKSAHKGIASSASGRARSSAISIVEKSQSSNQNLSRLSANKKNDKDVKPCAKFHSPLDRLANSPKTNCRSKFSLRADVQTHKMVSSRSCNSGDKNVRSLASSENIIGFKKRNIKIDDMSREITKICSKKKGTDIDCSQTSIVDGKKPVDKAKGNLNKTPARTKPNLNVQSKVHTFLRKKPVTEPSTLLNNNKVSSPKNKMQSHTNTVVNSLTKKSINKVNNHHVETQIHDDMSLNCKINDVELENNITDLKSQETGIELNSDVDNQNKGLHTDLRLCIPKLSLTTERSIQLEDSKAFESKSLPNLVIPTLKITQEVKTDRKDEVKRIIECKNIDEPDESFAKSKSTSLIIGEATVTYTTQQKINFQVVETKTCGEEKNRAYSPLSAYPFNVFTVLKRSLQQKHHNTDSLTKSKKCDYEVKTQSDVYYTLSDIALRPNMHKKGNRTSEIITAMQEKLFDTTFLSKQFQKELNFIDSFLESLQCLENSSLCEYMEKTKLISEEFSSNDKSDDKHITKAELPLPLTKTKSMNTSEEMQTIATKSLCLLNLLIQDEHRRAKNLLLVLKMREDALKDFTKSQILWLENRKKNDDIDPSALKKKQRGALVKLQHECGEMQRMKKALLTLSEKRKAALLQTKRNIEMKLTNNLDVDKILTNNKKRLKNTSLKKDDRTKLPLKCFDLLGSSCYYDETADSTKESTETQMLSDSSTNIIQIEKGIQTGESIMETLFKNHETKLSSESFICVDGGYLNILFKNLALPAIFSNGKEYEVNEIALKNILDSVNRLKDPESCVGGEVIKKFLKQSNSEISHSSSPSTARSLIEELDDYYTCLSETCHLRDKVADTNIGSNVCETSRIPIFESQPTYTTANLQVPRHESVQETAITLTFNESADDNSNLSGKNDKHFGQDINKLVQKENAEIYEERVRLTGFVNKTDQPEQSVSEQTVVVNEISHSNSEAAVISMQTSLHDIYLFTNHYAPNVGYKEAAIKHDPPNLDYLQNSYEFYSGVEINPICNRVSLKPSPQNSEDTHLTQETQCELDNEVEKFNEQSLVSSNISSQIEAVGKAEANAAKSSRASKNSPPWILLHQDTSTLSIPAEVLTSESATLVQNVSSLSSFSEAEELRKKQLAIELEIKALEQQQSQLLLVREIPDKPPPPYTPPSPETVPGNNKKAFILDFPLDRQKVKESVHYYCEQILKSEETNQEDDVSVKDAFDAFIYDYCHENVSKYNLPESIKPWEPCNIIPQKVSTNSESLQSKINSDLQEVLGYDSEQSFAACPYVQNKKSDYIDDILFTEWRKCESEWTALETDEINVKNQVFESIFDKICNEALVEYNKMKS